MDDRRFDAFTRSLGQRGSRRAALKTLLGIGGIAAVGGVAFEDDVLAARRPTPVSRPPRCPGSQTPCATGCCCPSGTQNCGGDCCPTGDYSVCCDGACCNGICYGEELCCPLGQLVCGGVCLPPGACCTDFDCTSARCLNNACVPYTPTSTSTNTPTNTSTPTSQPTNTVAPSTNTAVPPTMTSVPPTQDPRTLEQICADGGYNGGTCTLASSDCGDTCFSLGFTSSTCTAVGGQGNGCCRCIGTPTP